MICVKIADAQNDITVYGRSEFFRELTKYENYGHVMNS